MNSRISILLIPIIILLPALFLATGFSMPESFSANDPDFTALPISYALSSQFSPFEDHPEAEPVVLIGAGDISVCGWAGGDYTAALIERLLVQFPKAEIFTAGDNAQTIGDIYEYTDCFRSTWGRFFDRIHPSPGNHDWDTFQGEYYFKYFKERAGEPGLGYYSYNLGDWHLVSLNSNCADGRCDEDSPQAQWLRDDLQKDQHTCTLAYWHHPLRSSGVVPIETGSDTFWKIASDLGVDVVVNGHDHHYERFTPLDRDGNPDAENGIRSFIVGTGGAWLFKLGKSLEITEARDNSTNGVILFFLYPDHYDWMFVPVNGEFYTDYGSGVCS